jgi:hypothetical protein
MDWSHGPESKPQYHYKNKQTASHWWLMPVVLHRRQRSGGWQFEASLSKQFMRPYLKNPFTKIGLVERLMTAKKKCTHFRK